MKRNLYLMYAIALLQGMVFYGPIATLYRQAQGVSVFQITLIESLSMALAVALEIPWGVIADKIGYRHTMIFCSVLFFASKLVSWLGAVRMAVIENRPLSLASEAKALHTLHAGKLGAVVNGERSEDGRK